MPSDLSWLLPEFIREMNEKHRRAGDGLRTFMLRGHLRTIRVASFKLDPEDCDVTTRRRLRCWLLGHLEIVPHWMAECHCGAIAGYCTDDGFGRFVHVGRCARCNTLFLPRARVER